MRPAVRNLVVALADTLHATYGSQYRTLLRDRPANTLAWARAFVERVQLPGEQTHFTTPGVSAPLYVPWVKDRVAGKPIASGCPQDK